MVPDTDDLTDAYRRMAEQAAVQQHIEEMLEDRMADKEITVPDDLADRVKKCLDETPATSWDQAVQDIVLEDFENTDED